jgi:hypothetical protein
MILNNPCETLVARTPVNTIHANSPKKRDTTVETRKQFGRLTKLVKPFIVALLIVIRLPSGLALILVQAIIDVCFYTSTMFVGMKAFRALQGNSTDSVWVNGSSGR